MFVMRHFAGALERRFSDMGLLCLCTLPAAAARRYPRGGAWSIGLLGFAGATAIYFVLPEIGKIYDRAKLEAAGGSEAFAALPPGTELQRVLAYAAEQSFQVIAVVPVALFFIFGAVWLAERRWKAAGKPIRPLTEQLP